MHGIPPNSLLVAGPSGAGKSTFIDQLRQGALSREILAELPPSAMEWPVIEANNCVKLKLAPRQLLPSAIKSEGIVLHYDTVLIHRYGLRHYRDDPAFALVDDVSSLVIISVRSAAEQVRRQHARRRVNRRTDKSRFSRWWGDRVRLPLRHTLAHITGGPRFETEELYADPSWLEGCYERWDQFKAGLAKNAVSAKVIDIEPFLDKTGDYRFRICLGDSRTTSA